MATFSADDIVHLWEVGRQQHLLDRALSILACACPDMGRERLAALTIGQRDALLFELREQTFGHELAGLVECPTCSAHLEFSLPAADWRALTESQSTDSVHSFDVVQERLKTTFRLPDSRDLTFVTVSGTPETSRDLLVRRCLIEASIDGKPVSTSELPDAMVALVVERMAECEPIADIQLNLSCPSCNAGWQQSFDIVSFFWTEITALAKRLLREVHTLALAYGWREADILSMSPSRRNNYLEMLGG